MILAPPSGGGWGNAKRTLWESGLKATSSVRCAPVVCQAPLFRPRLEAFRPHGLSQRSFFPKNPPSPLLSQSLPLLALERAATVDPDGATAVL
jgi:hypothetical protein